MQLKYFLSLKDKKKLHKFKTDGNKKGKNIRKQSNKPQKKKSQDKEVNLSNNRRIKDRELYKENKIERDSLKAKVLKECPYCACENLEITGNNYYYCEECGFKVEKRK